MLRTLSWPIKHPARENIRYVIFRTTSSSSKSENNSPQTALVDNSPQVTASKAEGPINAQVIWRNEEGIKKAEESLYDIVEPEPVIIPQRVKQEWISKINVEYHGTVAENFNNETEWLPIYRLPYLNRFRIAIKAKVYLTVFSLGLLIDRACNLILGKFSIGATPLLLLSTTTLVGLILTGDYFRRLTCQIYVTEDLRFVRISRFTFFGRRRDLVLPIDCIKPLPEINPSYRVPVLKLRFVMPENIDLEKDEYEFYEGGLRILIKLGGILDRERFKLALGNIFLRVGE